MPYYYSTYDGDGLCAFVGLMIGLAVSFFVWAAVIIIQILCIVYDHLKAQVSLATQGFILGILSIIDIICSVVFIGIYASAKIYGQEVGLDIFLLIVPIITTIWMVAFVYTNPGAGAVDYKTSIVTRLNVFGLWILWYVTATWATSGIGSACLYGSNSVCISASIATVLGWINGIGITFFMLIMCFSGNEKLRNFANRSQNISTQQQQAPPAPDPQPTTFHYTGQSTAAQPGHLPAGVALPPSIHGQPTSPYQPHPGMLVSPNPSYPNLPASPALSNFTQFTQPHSGVPTSPSPAYPGLPTSPQQTYSGLPTSPQLTYSGLPTSPQQTHPGLPTSPQQTYSGLPTLPQQTHSGLPTLPQQMYSGLPISPQQTYSGLPTSPSLSYPNHLPASPSQFTQSHSGQPTSSNQSFSGPPHSSSIQISGQPISPVHSYSIAPTPSGPIHYTGESTAPVQQSGQPAPFQYSEKQAPAEYSPFPTGP